MSSLDIGRFDGTSPYTGGTHDQKDVTPVPAELIQLGNEVVDSGEKSSHFGTTESHTANSRTARRLERKKKGTKRRIVAGSIAGLLVMAGVGSYLGVKASGAPKVRKSTPIHNSFLEGLPKQFPNVLDVRPDPEHPGLEEVTYIFTSGHASLSHAYLTVDPTRKQGFDDAIGNLETYNGGNRIVRYGGILTFLVDTRSKPGAGIIVANPDQAPGVQN